MSMANSQKGNLFEFKRHQPWCRGHGQSRRSLKTLFVTFGAFAIIFIFISSSPNLRNYTNDTRMPASKRNEYDSHMGRRGKTGVHTKQAVCLNSQRGYEFNPRHDLLNMPKPNLLKKHKNPCWKDDAGRLRCLPYMFLVGMAKCGTTDLFKRITLHPDFVPPTDKEPSWLTGKRFYLNTSLEDYSGQFFQPISDILNNSTGGDRYHITGDGSVNTLEGGRFWNLYGKNVNQSEPVENNAEYIKYLIPEARILINVRDPVNRLWSEYLAFSKADIKSAERFHSIVVRQIHMYNQCMTSRSLRSCAYDWTLATMASLTGRERYKFLQCGYSGQSNYVLLRRGFYHVFIRDFLKVFPKDRVLVQRLEDIQTNTTQVLDRVFKFLKMRTLKRNEWEHVMQPATRNTRTQSNRDMGDMLPATRRLLYKFYKPHNEELASLLQDRRYLYKGTGSLSI